MFSFVPAFQQTADAFIIKNTATGSDVVNIFAVGDDDQTQSYYYHFYRTDAKVIASINRETELNANTLCTMLEQNKSHILPIGMTEKEYATLITNIKAQASLLGTDKGDALHSSKTIAISDNVALCY